MAIEKLLGFKLKRTTIKGFEQSSLKEVQKIEADLNKKHGSNNRRRRNFKKSKSKQKSKFKNRD